ncbi:hypothetical protein CFII68_26271 [Pseudomonas sp. CFII68]|nr:hypothetical protein CFII68_26271 [Pseudomonas sp. CFII68]
MYARLSSIKEEEGVPGAEDMIRQVMTWRGPHSQRAACRTA